MVSVLSQHFIIEAQKMKSPLIEWMSETRFQGCTHVQSLIISLDHKDIVIQYCSYINVGHTYTCDCPEYCKLPSNLCHKYMRMTTVSAVSTSNNTLTTWTTCLFDSNVMASYLRDARLSASLFALIKSRSGGQSLRVETNRWLRPKLSTEQHVCRHCSMQLQADEAERHFLFDCPFYQHH